VMTAASAAHAARSIARERISPSIFCYPPRQSIACAPAG
jgi:hypothetical protein